MLEAFGLFIDRWLWWMNHLFQSQRLEYDLAEVLIDAIFPRLRNMIDLGWVNRSFASREGTWMPKQPSFHPNKGKKFEDLNQLLRAYIKTRIVSLTKLLSLSNYDRRQDTLVVVSLLEPIVSVVCLLACIPLELILSKRICWLLSLGPRVDVLELGSRRHPLQLDCWSGISNYSSGETTES